MRYASFASLLFLAACASTPETQFHILPNLVPTESALFEGESVALRALDLPLYARASQVAHLQGGSIALEDEHRWADEPQRATTRALASALRRSLDVPVLVEPWSRSAEPALRIDVSVDRFVGGLGTTLELEGEFQLVDLAARNVQRAETFAISVPVSAESFEALTFAHSAALAALSDQIVAAIAAGS